MADEREIIISVQLDQQGAASEMDKLRVKMLDLAEQKKKLNEEYRKGKKDSEEATITDEEYVAELHRIEQAQKAIGKSFKDLSREQEINSNSINALRLQNRRLIEERDNLDMSIDGNKKRIDEINQKLNENTEILKANVSQYEKDKINIGNYKSALEGVGGSIDKIIPGFGGMSQGLSGITAGAKAFTATPFGAALQLISVALQALNGYLNGSVEGQKTLNQITQVTGALMEKFADLVEFVGEKLIGAFTNPKQALMDLGDFIQGQIMNRLTAFGVVLEGIVNLDFKKIANGVLQFSTGVQDVIGKAQKMGDEIKTAINTGIDQGMKIAALQDDIRERENKYKIESARVDSMVFALREKAIKQEGEERMKTIQQAIDLEKNLSEKSIAISEKKLALAKLEAETKGEDKEAVKNIADAEAELARARSQSQQATLRFQKEIESLRDKDIAEKNRLAEQEKKNAEDLAKQAEDNAKREAKAANDLFVFKAELAAKQTTDEEERFKLLVAAEDAKREFLLQNAELTESEIQLIKSQSSATILQLEKEKNEKIIALEKEKNQKQKDEELAVKKTRLEIIGTTISGLQQIFKQGTIASKAAALADIGVNTALGYIQALDIAQKSAKGTGPLAAFAFPVFYASQIAAVLGAAAKAKQVIGFADGGLSGTRVNSSHGIPVTRSNGDNILATIRTGEVILNQRQQAALGGESTFRRIGVPGFASGGLVGSETIEASRVNRTSIQIDELLKSLSEQRPVLVLEEFEYASTRKSSAQQNAVIV